MGGNSQEKMFRSRKASVEFFLRPSSISTIFCKTKRSGDLGFFFIPPPKKKAVNFKKQKCFSVLWKINEGESVI